MRPTSVKGSANTGPSASHAVEETLRSLTASAEPESDEFPIAAAGFAGTAEFGDAAADVATHLNLPVFAVVQDSWLIRVLHGVSGYIDSDGAVGDTGCHWVFAGGTSLTAAWRLVQRWSEDVDGLLWVPSDTTRSGFRKKRDICVAVANEICARDGDIDGLETAGNSSWWVAPSHLTVGGRPGYLKFETAMLRAHPTAVSMIEEREICSLLSTYGDPAWLEEYPELGGFTLPCMRPAWTVVNKFDALHRRAVQGDLKGLAGRGRDLYDLAVLSNHQDVADESHATIEELWPLAAGGLGREIVERPAEGYAASPAFAVGSPACVALERGYSRALGTSVFGAKPSFEEAVAGAQSLDDRP